MITFANFNTSQYKQTHVCVDKVVKRPEDPFPRVCDSVTYGKSRNVVNAQNPKGCNYNCSKIGTHVYSLSFSTITFEIGDTEGHNSSSEVDFMNNGKTHFLRQFLS